MGAGEEQKRRMLSNRAYGIEKAVAERTSGVTVSGELPVHAPGLCTVEPGKSGKKEPKKEDLAYARADCKDGRVNLRKAYSWWVVHDKAVPNGRVGKDCKDGRVNGATDKFTAEYSAFIFKFALIVKTDAIARYPERI